MLDKGFSIGVNYWASNAGMYMWRQFDENVVDKDFKKLGEMNIKYIRLFPLWPDFQPLTKHYTAGNTCTGLRFGETAFPDTDAGFYGVDEEMMNRFQTVLDLAKKHQIKVCVSLITGWMSGRLFTPSAFEGVDLMNDSTAVRYEQLFVEYFVNRFKNDSAIIAWSSGNETDCLGGKTEEIKCVWEQNIRNAIRANDQSRIITEAMHPVRRSGTAPMRARKNIADVTTVHPYTFFTPFAMNENMHSVRALRFAVTEAKICSDITGKPCLVEEIGTLGDFACSKAVSAGFAKANMLSSYINGMTGFFWWCANEQSHLEFDPYDTQPIERELGIFDKNGEPKPVAYEMKEFVEFLQTLPFENLPKPDVDAVCILQGGGYDWCHALGADVLSVQAGINLKFANQESIPESDLYIFPCYTTAPPFRRDNWQEMLKRVKNGASLYISYRDGFMSEFEEVTGNELIFREETSSPLVTEYGNLFERYKITMQSKTSTVLMKDGEGNPLFTVNNYGKGKVYFFAAPLECDLSEAKGGFSTKFAEVYRTLANETLKKSVQKENFCIGLTEHTNKNKKYVCAMNYSGSVATDTLKIKNGLKIGKIYRGNIAPDGKVSIPPFDAVIFEIE